MSRLVVVAALAACLAPAEALAQKDKLVGRWQSEVDGSVVELRRDGTATTADGEVRWAVQGQVLIVGEALMAYRLQGDKIFITLQPGVELAYKRLAPAKGNPKSAQAAAQKQGGEPVDVQLRQLLLSSAWCSFRYNKITGASSTSRVVFHANGTAQMNTGAESHTSGQYGSVAGQSWGGGGLRWKVQGGRLLVDSGEGFQDIGLVVTVNSSGYPILKADGKEYSRCQ